MIESAKHIYISGKVTGIENKAYELFEQAEIKLKNSGYLVCNPMKINHDYHDKSWESYMKLAIKNMLDCDEIYMLKNYTSSKGALLELAIAKELGIKIKYEIYDSI